MTIREAMHKLDYNTLFAVALIVCGQTFAWGFWTATVRSDIQGIHKREDEQAARFLRLEAAIYASEARDGEFRATMQQLVAQVNKNNDLIIQEIRQQ